MHVHVYVWEHIVSLYYRIAEWMFTKLGRDEVLMVPYKCCCFLSRSVQGRIQGGAKKGQGGGPLLQRISSSDWKATATNQMDSNDLEACGKKCCYFWFHCEVKFLTRFRHLFGLLVILPYFNAIDVFPIIFDARGLRPDMLRFPCVCVMTFVLGLWRHRTNA